LSRILRRCSQSPVPSPSRLPKKMTRIPSRGRSTVTTVVLAMPIGLDVQVHAKVLGALMRQQRSLVREYPPRRRQLFSLFPRRDSLVAYHTRPRRTLQSAIAVAAILSGSSIGLFALSRCTCHLHHHHSLTTSSSCRSSPSSCSSLWRTVFPHPKNTPRSNRDGQMPCDSSTTGVLGRILDSTCRGTNLHLCRCRGALQSRESPILPLLPIHRDAPQFFCTGHRC
jgi:hypothetical protein